MHDALTPERKASMMPSNSGSGIQMVMIPSINVIEGVLKTLSPGVVGYIGNCAFKVKDGRLYLHAGTIHERSVKIRAPRRAQTAECALAHQIQDLLQPKTAPQAGVKTTAKARSAGRVRSSRTAAPAL